MNLELIKKYLADNPHNGRIDMDMYETHWLPYLKEKGIDKQIIQFTQENNLKSWENEILLLAGFYRVALEDAQWFSNYYKGKTMDSNTFEYIKQKNALIDLIDDLNVRRRENYDEQKKAPYIENILIRTSNNIENSLRIDNYSFCYDIADLLREHFKIPKKYYEWNSQTKEYVKVSTPKFEVEKTNTKKASYIKKFLQDTYPIFLFFKDECNLNLPIWKYYELIAKFLEAIGFNFKENKITQDPEDYFKNCYKQLINRRVK